MTTSIKQAALRVAALVAGLALTTAAVNARPLPGVDNTGSPYCFGDGSGADCPCSGWGVYPAGCLNTAYPGALLRGFGDAAFGHDTFYLNIVGIPDNKPGLVLKGNNQVSITAGDGILCTTGGSRRSQVQVSVQSVATFTDFNGLPFGSVANDVGVPTNFQFWYRDPVNICTSSGFNFSNGWTVTYLP